MVECLTALSTLQAENKRLKSLLGEGGQDLWSKENQRADRLEAESEKLRAELEQARESLDFARTKDAEIVRLGKELEQARAEITRLKHYEEKCHDCPIVCAKTEIIKAHEELEAAQNERDMWKEGMEDCQQSILELEAELEQAKRERDAAISDLTYIAQTYPVDLCDDLVCQYCKHYPNVNTGCPGWAENDCFEWRGPEEG